jgi:hypothetical protein
MVGPGRMLDFVRALTTKIKKNKAALELHTRIYDPPATFKSNNLDIPLSIKHLYHHVQVLTLFLCPPLVFLWVKNANLLS